MFTLDATDHSAVKIFFPSLGVQVVLSPSSAGMHVLLRNNKADPIIEEFLSREDIASPAYQVA